MIILPSTIMTKFGKVPNNVPQYIPYTLAKTLLLLKANFTNTTLRDLMLAHIDNLESNGLFDQMEYEYPLVTDSADSTIRRKQMSINLTNPSWFKLIHVNNPTFNYTGIKYTLGLNNYSNTRFIPEKRASRMSAVSGAGGAYMITNVGNSTDFGTNNIGGVNKSISMSNNLGTDLYNSMNGDIYFNGTPITSTGLKTALRVSGTLYNRSNGSNIYTVAHTYNGKPELPILLGALGPIGNGIYSNNEYCHFFLSGFSSLADMATYEGLVNTLQTDIENALGLTAGDRKKY